MRKRHLICGIYAFQPTFRRLQCTGHECFVLKENVAQPMRYTLPSCQVSQGWFTRNSQLLYGITGLVWKSIAKFIFE